MAAALKLVKISNLDTDVQDSHGDRCVCLIQTKRLDPKRDLNSSYAQAQLAHICAHLPYSVSIRNAQYN